MRDTPISRFYCARDLTPDETFASIEAALKTALVNVRDAYRSARLVMTGARLTSFHRAIFGGLFTEWQGAGRYRQAHEPTEFSVPVMRDGKWTMKTVHGAAPEYIGMELAFVLQGWNGGFWEAVATQPGAVPLADATLAVAKLYTGLIRVHPFVVGNHRASFLAYAAALSSLGLPLVEFVTDAELIAHDRAVGAAIDPKQDDPEPFARLLATRLRAVRP
jgi:fido (protein-threonine AMPylation protein)